ncbi:MAG: peptidyl-prolyl cis-trans isomerase, partial [Betaproteobacteria bacterium]|nr:peptidyl-prolyl cis-trans isomerase [Betaproteobacteria bacterium]
MTKTVTMTTAQGSFTIELDDAKAPLTVENFLSYVRSGHYDGTVFHRVIKGFMVQGGGFAPGMKQKPTQGEIKNEANNGLKNLKYTLAMARTSAPHSASSQFFINATNNSFLDHSSESAQGWGYAVFGRVVS